MEPREWILPTSLINNGTDSANAAAAASNPILDIPVDPIQQGEISLHSWQLYTPEALVLDLRGKKVTSSLDLGDAFCQLHLCSTDNNQQEETSSDGRRKRQKTHKSK